MGFYRAGMAACYILFEIVMFLSIKLFNFFNRPGVAGAVLQSASFTQSLSHSVSQPFPPNLQNIINHKPEELGG